MRIKIAFIKYAGLSAGGTEKFLQNIAANLPKDQFEVDYFYCDATPFVGLNYRHADTNPDRLKYLESHGVRLIKFQVEAVNGRSHLREWINTNFWNLFRESDYDIVQTGRAGSPEYPFYKIKQTPIVDSIHLFAGVDNQFNISRVMHVSEWNAKKWTRAGGDGTRLELVSHPIDAPPGPYADIRGQLNLNQKFTFGFHQRPDDKIFSPIPLGAYKEIESDDTAFILLGGSENYSKQAHKLGLKNFFALPANADPKIVYGFLSALNVYAHGRKDGEINSTAMAEAMFFGLPIVSHLSKIHNGHILSMGEAGKVVGKVPEYTAELKKLKDDNHYYAYRQGESKKRFAEHYALSSQMGKIIQIYKDVIKEPFPNPMRRKVAALRLRYILLYSFVRAYNKLRRVFTKQI